MVWFLVSIIFTFISNILGLFCYVALKKSGFQLIPELKHFCLIIKTAILNDFYFSSIIFIAINVNKQVQMITLMSHRNRHYFSTLTKFNYDFPLINF